MHVDDAQEDELGRREGQGFSAVSRNESSAAASAFNLVASSTRPRRSYSGCARHAISHMPLHQLAELPGRFGWASERQQVLPP